MSKCWSHKIDQLSESATVAVNDRARELKQKGLAVVNMGGGDPDFPTPPHIVSAAVNAIRDGFTHYVASRGVPEFRKAISDKFLRDNQIVYDPDREVIATVGGKAALYIAMAAILEPGDEVLYFDPAWVSYEPLIRMMDAVPVDVPLRPREGFALNGEILERRISPRTKAIIVNSPNNPTGRVLTLEELTVLAELAVKYKIWVLSDEIYEPIVYDGARHISPASLPGLRELTVTLNGMSKTYAMTGWRIGYLGAPARLCEQILKVQSHVITCASSFSQVAGTAALTASQDCVQEMVAEYDRRRRFMVDALNAIPGVDCPLPQGAFYLFPQIDYQGMDSVALARFLIDNAHVAVTPGAAFGKMGEKNIRLHFATSMEELEKAAEQMAKALK